MAGDVVERFLPPHFLARIPAADRAWRGRVILAAWVIGYPLEMAWALGMSDDPTQVAAYRASVADCDDERLIADLEATAAARGDGSHLEFMQLGWPEDP